MDKRLLYIVVGLLVIIYLVCRKAHPELLEDLQTRSMAVLSGKPAPSPSADAGKGEDQWEAHRQDVFTKKVAESKRNAIAKYPALALADSEINIRFVSRYKSMIKDGDPRLKAPNWPELLADDCAAASAVHATPPKTSASKPHPVAGAGGSADPSLVTR